MTITTGIENYTPLIGSADYIISVIEREFVKLLRKYLTNVNIYVEFPQKRVQTPSIALTIHDVKSSTFSLGNIVGVDDDGNDVYGLYWFLQMDIDGWALDTKTRDDILSIISLMVMMEKANLFKTISLVDLEISSAQERGFDMTDRIIQYASHQITDVQRQLLIIDFQVLSTYTPILEHGYIKSIVVSLGQNTQVLGEDVTVIDTFTTPSDIGDTYDSYGLLMLEPRLIRRNFNRIYKRIRLLNK